MSGTRRTAADLAPLTVDTADPIPWDLHDLAGIADIAAALLEPPAGGHRANRATTRSNTVTNWTARYPDFPRPLHVLVAAGPLYSLAQVTAWHDAKWPRPNRGQQGATRTREEATAP